MYRVLLSCFQIPPESIKEEEDDIEICDEEQNNNNRQINGYVTKKFDLKSNAVELHRRSFKDAEDKTSPGTTENLSSTFKEDEKSVKKDLNNVSITTGEYVFKSAQNQIPQLLERDIVQVCIVFIIITLRI